MIVTIKDIMKVIVVIKVIQIDIGYMNTLHR